MANHSSGPVDPFLGRVTHRSTGPKAIQESRQEGIPGAGGVEQSARV
jgi:hypothetical protein